jgi:hypothetical protein
MNGGGLDLRLDDIRHRMTYGGSSSVLFKWRVLCIHETYYMDT